MSGLGIDFGVGDDRPLENGRIPSQQPRSKDGTPASGRQNAAAPKAKDRSRALPKKSSMSKLRRPTTDDERAEARRVRIASGEPGVLGHGAYTDEDFLSPSSATYSSSSEDVVIRRHVPVSLSAAALTFAAASPSTNSAAGESLITSDENSSPATTSSVTSFSSGSSGRGRSKTLKKHASQPQLSRSGTTKVANKGPPPANSKAVSRSLSSASLSTAYKSDSGSSLGRSSEIPRSGSRTGSVRGRGYGRGGLRGGHAGTAIPRQAVEQAQPTASIGCDVSVSDHLEDEASALVARPSTQKIQRPGSLRSLRTASSSDVSSVVGQPCFDGPSLLSRISMDGAAPISEQAISPKSVSRPRAQDNTQPHVGTGLQYISDNDRAVVQDRPTQWRVGSFYAPNGEETGHIDADGVISRQPSRVPTVISTSSRPSVASSTDRSSNRSRAQSVGAPRAKLMSSPSQANSEAISQERNGELQQDGSKSSTAARTLSMRSARGLRGLEGAERGESMVSYDRLNRAFENGLPIMPGNVETADQQSLLASTQISFTEGQDSQTRTSHRMSSSVSQSSVTPSGESAEEKRAAHSVKTRPRRSLSEAAASSVSLDRQGTLLSTGANPIRRSKELNRLLGNSGRKLPASAASVSDPSVSDGDKGKGKLQRSNATGSFSAPPAALEQGKASKARVEVDLVLESDLVVEGGTMNGRMQIKLRKAADKEGAVMLAQPKIRVVGFEELLNDDTRHIFYHHASVIDGDRSSGGPSEPYYLHGSPTFSSPEARSHSSLPCYAGSPDSEGFTLGKEGLHSIPFSLDLPISKGAKGSYRGKNAVVRYIVIGSVKLKSAGGSNRSIAHFYRHLELYPYLNPALVLSSAPRPIQASTSKGLFLGGSGKVHVTASLHRATWVAGQRVYVNVAVQNETNKKINSMTLSLIRTVTLYRPRPELDMAKRSSDGYYDPDACQTSTTRKKITEEELEMGQKGSKGVVTAKGWWTGVEAGGSVDFSHYTTLPSDALSISRGRHVEVTYAIKVSVGSSLSSDVSVELPLRVVNFVSLDPPPLRGKSASSSPVGPGAPDRVKSWTQMSAAGNSVDPMIARVKSIEALRSPVKAELSLHGGSGHYLSAQPQAAGSESETERTRRLQHQKSLDFINHAIRSATARRGVAPPSTETSPMGLGIAIADEQTGPAPVSTHQARSGDVLAALAQNPTHNMGLASPSAASSIGPIHPSCLPYDRVSLASTQDYGPVPKLRVMNAVSADERDDDDDFEGLDPDRTLGLNDESVDEVDLVIGSSKTDRENSPSFRDVQYSRAEDPDISASFDESAMYDEHEEHASIDNVDGEDECMEMIPEVEGEGDISANQTDKWRADVEEVDENWETDDQEDVAEVSQLMQVIPQSMAETHHSEAEDTDAASPVTAPKATAVPIEPRRDLPTPQQKGRASTQGVRDSDAGRPAARAAPSPSPVVAKPSPVPTARQSPAASAPQTTAPLRIRARPSSPVKVAVPPASPVKPALKPKSSFTFATGQNPLKTAKETPKMASSTPVLRAKVSQEQIAAPAVARSSKTTPKLPDASKKKDGSRRSEEQPRKRGGSSGKHAKAGQSSRKAAGTASGSDTPSDTTASSPATSTGAETPESICSELPRFAANTAGRKQVAAIDEDSLEQGHAVGLDPFQKGRPLADRISMLPRSVSSKGELLARPDRHEGTLKHSASVADLGDDSLKRSGSTHNLRGSSIVVPSVRNKIAMLENRNQALKDFTAGCASGPRTPTRAGGGSGMSTPTASGTPGRVAQLAASAEKVRQNSLTSPLRLARKESNASVASSDVSSIVQPDYLRRSTSIMSFKAPMLRSVQQ